jgi:hypothetical protein
MASLLALGGVRPAFAQRGAELEQPPGVRLGLQYRPGQKVAVTVLPVGGAHGDSIGTMLGRDLDFSDRFTVITARFGGPASAPPGYPVLAKVGVDAAVHAVPLASGGVRVALHDVTRKVVVTTRDFPLPTPVYGATPSTVCNR